MTGKPCKHGHISERMVDNGACCECVVIIQRESKRRYYEKNRERLIKYVAQRAIKNKDEISKYQSDYRKVNSIKLAARSKAHYEENKADRAIKQKEYNSRPGVIESRRAKRNEKLLLDPVYAMSVHCRGMVHRILRKTHDCKHGKTFEILGYSGGELRSHIESLFLPGMGWHNRREWHIDHKVSISKMMSAGVTEPRLINALSNLQPLWAADNLKKGAH